jgi:precorrin-6Y C5,15-methyltransferase (decarboxylating)
VSGAGDVIRFKRRDRRVLVVGVGDDGPAGLPPVTLARIERAELLVGGRRHLELFEGTSGERLTIADGLDEVIRRIDEASANRRVVVLASGDPCYFGIGPALADRLGRERVEVVPHVSSVALAFARLGLSWQDARVVSAHGRPLEDAVRAAGGATKLAVLTDDTHTPGVVAEALLAAGVDDVEAWVFEHLGGEREREFQMTLGGLSRERFAALNVLVVPELRWTAADVRDDGAVAADESIQTGFGLPESAYAHTAGLITKPEIRAVSLSKLRLPAGGVLWDVGSGSGSLSIEAAGLATGLTVYAVERSPRQAAMLRANVCRLADQSRVQVVEGEAPAALAGLPDPDAVFVGGSGGRLTELLETSAARLSGRGGRIVLNLVLLDRVAEALAWARARSVSAEVVQVGVARGVETGGAVRLQAENPVTIVTLAP